MTEILDRILQTYSREFDPDFLEASRDKVSRYVETLASAGNRDSRQLMAYGYAYLKELREGPDPRYSGC